jgi:hypothetical protein
MSPLQFRFRPLERIQCFFGGGGCWKLVEIWTGRFNYEVIIKKGFGNTHITVITEAIIFSPNFKYTCLKLEGLEMENVGIFYSRLVYFITIWYILKPLGIFVVIWYTHFSRFFGCSTKNLVILPGSCWGAFVGNKVFTYVEFTYEKIFFQFKNWSQGLQSRYRLVSWLMGYIFTQSNRNWWKLCRTYDIWKYSTIQFSRVWSILSFVVQHFHMSYDTFICRMTLSYVVRHFHMLHDTFRCRMTLSYVVRHFHMSHDTFRCRTTLSDVARHFQMLHDTICRIV